MFHVFSLVCFLIYGVKRRQVLIAKPCFYFYFFRFYMFINNFILFIKINIFLSKVGPIRAYLLKFFFKGVVLIRGRLPE